MTPVHSLQTISGLGEVFFLRRLTSKSWLQKQLQQQQHHPLKAKTCL